MTFEPRPRRLARPPLPGAWRVAMDADRVGSKPGAVALSAVAAAHRAAALDACRAILEEIQRSAPLWKKEHHADGSSWGGRGS